ncbi:methyl-accepting chemotaxis sensory transducer with phytochrome sensor [Stanieria sp. NIES-3757]|nr:methyl-accepting chemotaxis sensory transducer with phytochrome sensor [Stanieria sp. NIES-3757]
MNKPDEVAMESISDIEKTADKDLKEAKVLESKQSNQDSSIQTDWSQTTETSLFKQEQIRFEKIRQQIHQLTEYDSLLNTTVAALREDLQASRVLIYRFNNHTSGQVIAESLVSGWTPSWEENLPCLVFGAQQAADYSNQIVTIKDLAQTRLTPYQMQLLEKFQVKASLSLPILLKTDAAKISSEEVWGLLVIHQCDRPRQWQETDIILVERIIKELSLAIHYTEIVSGREHDALREKTCNKVLEKIRNCSELSTIFKTVTQEVIKLLKADRTVIYQFNSDWSGKVVAESVGSGWVSLLVEQNNDEPDSFLRDTQGGEYVRGQKFSAVEDIYSQDFSSCYVELLEKYQAKAYLIVPIFQGGKLWGLFASYQNSSSRHWHQSEIDLMMQIGNQLAVALQQAQLLEKIHKHDHELAQSNERETAIVQFSARLVSRLAELAGESTDTNTILNFAASELRQVLKLDRVGVFRFYPDWTGEFIVESVGSNWLKLVGTELAQVRDTYLQETQGGRYVRRETLMVKDIYQEDYNQCHLELLEQWGTKAYAIAPIFQGEKLWGLLGIYQNDRVRHWEVFERAILEQVATQIGVTLQLSAYLVQVRSQEQQLSEVAERERTEREKLQQGALKVLRALEPSFSGDLTVRAPLSDDEIGTIADGYNTTIQTMRELVRQVQLTANRVSSTSNHNTTSVTRLSTEAQQQVERLQLALQELQLMVSSTQAVTANAQKVEQALQEANRTVNSGDLLMERTVDSILEMRETVSETAKKIKRLGEASQKISKVVNLIENFATQTNLLSLNAAIEATRAGEYGKGFAVVADEVRSLAYQSANATTEIERLVDEIQLGIKEVTETMELGITQVVQGSNLVNETRQSLSEIVTVTNQISELVEGISRTTMTQSQQSQSLTQAMTEVSTLAQNTLESSTVISQSFQELLTTSQELQTSVSQFIVD